jgi:hypothetical protein
MIEVHLFIQFYVAFLLNILDEVMVAFYGDADIKFGF